MKTEAQRRKVRAESPLAWQQVKQIAETAISDCGGARGFECFSQGMQERMIKAAAFDALWGAAQVGGGVVTPEQMQALRAALRMAAGIDRDDD